MARRRYTNRGRSSGGTRRRLFWARRRVNLTYTDAERAYPTDMLSEFQAAYDADLFGVHDHPGHPEPSSSGRRRATSNVPVVQPRIQGG